LRYTLVLILMASAAVAKEREPIVRSLYLSEDPRAEVRPVYVASERVTVLRFQLPCDPERTKMLGWEGRFEPVACVGKRVLIEPLQNLGSEDRFLLVVTLEDGKELPFTVTARVEQFDSQVDVFPDEESKGELRSRLAHIQDRERVLAQENERMRNEETSIDHALAALLAKGAVRMTPFRSHVTHLFKSPHGVEFTISIFASKNHDKYAVRINVKNNSSADPWSLLDARVVTENGGEQKPFAMRATRYHWEPGGTNGAVAIVLDGSVFDSTDAADRLVVEIFRRGSGLREAWVFVDRALLR
jgi:uncharacterized protein (TIGR02268 family)